MSPADPSAVVWWNGRLLPAAEAFAPAASQGMLWGRGLFETLRVRDGQALAVTRHLARLRLAAPRLGLEVPPAELLREAIHTVLSGAPAGVLRLRLTLTGPDKPGLLLDPEAPEPGQLLIQLSRPPEMPAAAAFSLITVPWRRNEFSPLAGIKATAYAENAVALGWARQRGADEALFLNTGGDLCEGATSNLFLAAADGTVLTPSLSSGCLPGITRGLVLELCGQLGIPCLEKALGPADLAAAGGIFVTNSLRGIQPVSDTGGGRRPRTPEAPCPVTARLSAALADLLERLPDP